MMQNLVFHSGLFFLSFFIWQDRGMRFHPSDDWGIIILAIWNILLIAFFIKGPQILENSIFKNRLGLLLGFGITLHLISLQVWSADVVIENPGLLNRGPIQIFPSNIKDYLFLSVLLCLFTYLLFQILNKNKSFQKITGISLIVFSAITHLLVLRLIPFPLIDVFTNISEATVGLLQGYNPYKIKYFDLYQGQGITPSKFGYMPGLFPWSISGMVVFGDIRGGCFLALTGTALLFCHDLEKSFNANKIYMAGMVFFGGAALFVTEQAWIDPILVFLVLISAYFIQKKMVFSAAILGGLLCSTKQYAIIAFSFLGLMVLNQFGSRQALLFAFRAVMTGIIIQLPFLVWDYQAYVNTVFIMMGTLPFRADAYTLISVLRAHGISGTGTPLIGIFLTSCLLFKCWKSKLCDPSTIILAMGFAYMAVFLTNRHAFCNYYQLVLLLFIGSLYFHENKAGATVSKASNL